MIIEFLLEFDIIGYAQFNIKVILSIFIKSLTLVGLYYIIKSLWGSAGIGRQA